MSQLTVLSEDQRDALQELMNVAMGQSADRLARLTSTFVTLSVPRVHAVTDTLDKVLDLLGLGKEAMLVTRQSFLGKLRGEVLVCFGEQGASELSGLMGYGDDVDASTQDELLMDVTNILTGACINGLAQQIQTMVSYGSPSLMARAKSLREVLQEQILQGYQSLVLEVRFEVESHSFMCDLLVCITDDSAAVVIEAVDQLLSDF
ncbi:chemotaxis protein CheC [Atopomonas sediminilitoris]|uniref:chemotaxis protein CheC n=1 Tax=Atopomonas sediminilitoris TaxID=2919919 RepID=UPI001F4D69B6|nr:chemotaxis protein CheC [Atopomonas sediminilitoris]MCJ8169478.1 chemotaxis protein CheC [Atopomonas sediminilitoris]